VASLQITMVVKTIPHFKLRCSVFFIIKKS